MQEEQGYDCAREYSFCEPECEWNGITIVPEIDVSVLHQPVGVCVCV